MLIQLPNIEASLLCNSCIVSEHKTKDVQGQGPFNITSPVSVFPFYDV